MSDLAAIDAQLAAARPQAVGALLRYFRDLDIAEEAFQEACLRALKNWPVNGPPRDPAAWLIFVGRNFALDEVRRRKKQSALPDDDLISDLDDAETEMAERLDNSQYRDDVLRLLFICCHPDLPATQQIAVALRIVSGLSVAEIARAFLVSESAMEQRITRAKRVIARADVPFEAPGTGEREERLGAVATMLYLLFNEGYSASGGDAHIRAPLCEEAIRLARLLLRLFPGEPEIMGLNALLLLQHARAPARLDPMATSCCWTIRTALAGIATSSRKVLRSWRRPCGIAVPDPIRCRPRLRASIRKPRALRTQTGRKSTGSTQCWRHCSPRRSSR
jgi:RNA polymerase sigma-70 factor (ECF subfamily)